MNFNDVISLSLLEGLTEFIPVSSTGHLILLGSIIGDSTEAEKFFDVFIQLGAILSVAVLYRDQVLSMIKSFNPKNNHSNLSYSPYAIIAAIFPCLIMGFLFYKHIKSLLFYPFPVAIALIVGGIGLIIVEKMIKQDSQSQKDVISLKDAFIIGLFQVLSLWPGMSRSGSCLIGSRLIKINRVLAAEFSFLVAVPLMFVAVAYDIYKNFHLFNSSEVGMFFLGFVIAFVSAMCAIKVFISYLSRFSLIPFGVYRIILGLIVLYLLG